MTRRPTDRELLEAAREHLAQVVPALGDPRLKFQTLVAAHVLGVVARELAERDRDPEAPARDRAALQALPGAPATDADLCAAIRAGTYDTGTGAKALHALLRTRVESDLAVWNPAFLARVRAG